MPFIITDPCIETKDTACVDVCPVDCIHPRKDEPEFAADDDALHPSRKSASTAARACRRARSRRSTRASMRRPSHQKDLIEANAIYRNGDADSMAQAEEIVKSHVAAHADIMAMPAAERQAAHARF